MKALTKRQRTRQLLKTTESYHRVLAQVKVLYKEPRNNSIRDVAREIGVSYGTAWKLVRDCGVTVRPRNSRPRRCRVRICSHAGVPQYGGHCRDMMCSNYVNKCPQHGIARAHG